MMKLEIGMPVVFKKPEDRYSKYDPLMYTSDMDEYSKGTIIEIDTDGDFRLDECPGHCWCEQWIDKKATKELWAKLFKDNAKVGMTVYHIEGDNSVITRTVTEVNHSNFIVDKMWLIGYGTANRCIKLRKTLSSWGWDKLGYMGEVPFKAEATTPTKKYENVAVDLSEIPEPYREEIAHQCFNVAVNAGYKWNGGGVIWKPFDWETYHEALSCNYGCLFRSDIGTEMESGSKFVTIQEWFKYFQENKNDKT